MRTAVRYLFAGLDDAEKLKSIYRVTGSGSRGSELLESDYDQLNIRLRGETETYKQIITTTLNPVDIKPLAETPFFSAGLSRA